LILYAVIYILIIAVVNGALSLMPAKLAKDKGCSFLAYWFLGFFLTFITCFMVAESLEDNRAPLGNWKPVNVQAKPAHPGRKDIPGYALMVVFLLGALILGASDGRFFRPENINNVLEYQFSFYAAAALVTALTMRAKGPDISFVPLAVLAGFIIASGDTYAGVAIALGVCSLVGVLNGIIITMTNIPAVITTLVTGVLTNLVTQLIFGGIKWAGIPVTYDLYPMPLIAAAVCVPLIFLTKLRLPKDRHLSCNSGALKNRAFWRKNLAYIAAYAASSAIACVAGFYLTAHVGVATIKMGSDLYEVIAIVFFAVSSVRLRHSKWSVFYALVPALAWALLGNAMNLFSMSSYEQMLVRVVVIMIFGAVFFLSRVKRSVKKKDQESVV
jgi:ribose transport system permease protein